MKNGKSLLIAAFALSATFTAIPSYAQTATYNAPAPKPKDQNYNRGLSTAASEFDPVEIHPSPFAAIVY